jgi:hypothetical protein
MLWHNWSNFTKKFWRVPVGDFPDSVNSAAMWGLNHRTVRGRAYGFIDYKDPRFHRPFLMLPLMVQPRVKGYKKSRQAGVSESCVTEALWSLHTYPMNVIYTFPSPKQLEDFSNIRVKDAITNSRDNSLKSMMGDPQNVTLKRLGKGVLYMRSSTNPKLGEGVDADSVYFDEIDRMKRGVGIAFKESLSSSRFGWQREISTPSLPGRGIDELWQKSNQMTWFVKCPACGKYQYLKYPENILELKPVAPHEKIIPPGSYAFCCSKCKSLSIDRWHGQWVGAYPSRIDHWCFHINQLMCCWISADEIMQKKKDYRFPQLFWNYVLGETYASDNILLTDHILDLCTDTALKVQVHRPPAYTYITVGIDWGSYNWAVVFGQRGEGSKKELIGLFMAEDSKEPLGSTKRIEEFIRPFRPDVIIPDWGYGKDRVTYLAKQFPGRVYGCTYANESRLVRPHFNEEGSTVSVDRTGWLKGMSHEFREQHVVIPDEDQAPLISTYRSHMKTLVTVLEEADDGTIKERIEETGDDHFAHATGYGLMGFEYKDLKGTAPFAFDFL